MHAIAVTTAIIEKVISIVIPFTAPMFNLLKPGITYYCNPNIYEINYDHLNIEVLPVFSISCKYPAHVAYVFSE